MCRRRHGFRSKRDRVLSPPSYRGFRHPRFFPYPDIDAVIADCVSSTIFLSSASVLSLISSASSDNAAVAFSIAAAFAASFGPDSIAA